jgi:MFS family permease
MSPIAKSPALVYDHPAPVDTAPETAGVPGCTDAERPAAWPARRSMELITLGWFFGSVWLTATTGSPTTVFLKGLGATHFQFGVVAALPFIASLLSLPSSLLIERTGERKKIFLYGLYFQRLLWFPIALLPLWLVSWYGEAGAPGAMKIFLLLMFIMHAAGAAGGPAWVSWMADVVPERLRGKYFSRRRQWGLASAIPTALLAGWLLDRCAATCDSITVLRWCAILFMCAAVFGLADIHLFQYLPGVPKAPRKGSGLLKALGGPLRDRQFLWFAAFVGTLTFAVGFMQQFITLFLLDKNHVGVSSGGTQLMVLVVPMAAQFLALPVWGMAVDRMGKKPVLALAGLGLVPVALGWCLLGPSNLWLGFVLGAAHMVLWSGIDIANFNLVLEMSGSAPAGEDSGGGSAYVAVNSVIVNVAGCMGGLVAGLIAQGLKDWSWTLLAGSKPFTFYDVLFILSGVLRLAAVVAFLPFIHEPGARSTLEALRFIAGSACSTLANVVVVPVRAVLRRLDAFARAQA